MCCAVAVLAEKAITRRRAAAGGVPLEVLQGLANQISSGLPTAEGIAA